MSSQNFIISKLPPETIATIGPRPAFSRERGGHRQSASAFDDDARLFGHQPHRSLGFIETYHEAAVHYRSHPLHMRGNRLWPPAPSTKDRFQSLNTWGDPLAKDNAAGAAVSGSAPQTLIRGFSAFRALPTPVINPPPPMAAMTATASGQSLKDLQAHRCVAGNEIVVVERVHERPVNSRESTISKGLPRRLHTAPV